MLSPVPIRIFRHLELPTIVKLYSNIPLGVLNSGSSKRFESVCESQLSAHMEYASRLKATPLCLPLLESYPPTRNSSASDMAMATRFLIISDTHGAWPYSPTDAAPKADVLLHCGDLTQVGGVASFKRAIEDIESSNAELKLVIAGNHDLELDKIWVRDNTEDEEDLKDHSKCVVFMQSHKSYGIHYLEESTHQFFLKDGRQFTVYASSYTPESNGYAFAYGEDEDRFNVGEKSVPANIDILMTHGPPLFLANPEYQLDVSHDGKHCGCKKLADAVQKTQPRLHCLGHLHEGRGALRVGWAGSENDKSKCASMEKVQDDGTVVRQSMDIANNESLQVNAAMYGPRKGWLVDLALRLVTLTGCQYTWNRSEGSLLKQRQRYLYLGARLCYKARKMMSGQISPVQDGAVSPKYLQLALT